MPPFGRRRHNEIVLTGVDVTSYGPDIGEAGLALVRAILTGVPELPRLRLSSIDAVEIDKGLLDIVLHEERLMPHLHLSLQAGDNMILKRMKRRHTREEAIGFCAHVAKQRPDVTFGADIIAGFPTETDAMFENSLALVAECNLVWLHVFPFHRAPAHRRRACRKLTARPLRRARRNCARQVTASAVLGWTGNWQNPVRAG